MKLLLGALMCALILAVDACRVLRAELSCRAVFAQCLHMAGWGQMALPPQTIPAPRGQVAPGTGTAIPNHSCSLASPGLGVAPGLWAVLRWEVALPDSCLGCWSLLPGMEESLCWSLRSAQCFLAVVSVEFSVGVFQKCFRELSKCVVREM